MKLLEKGMWTKRRVQRDVTPYREEAGEQRLKVGKTQADGRTMEFGVFSYRFTTGHSSDAAPSNSHKILTSSLLPQQFPSQPSHQEGQNI